MFLKQYIFMKKITKKKTGVSTGKIVAVSAGVAALGAGAYYFLGPNGDKNQKKASVWMNGMKKDILNSMIKIKDTTESMRHTALDAIGATYTKQYNEHAGDIQTFIKDIKKEWRGVKKSATPVVKKATTAVQKVVRPIKKTVKKNIKNK
jgi:hypothetical protein